MTCSEKSLFLVKDRESADPAINLATEEYLVRNLEGPREYLFIYKNNPSVVIGKHQNPFREADFLFLRSKNIALYRRISGGGTVYHDPGNINITFISNYSLKQFNNYFRFIKPVVDLLRGMGLNAALNKRNDVLVNGFKVSGNAQFSSRDRMLSHGTLLFDSDLDFLRNALNSKAKKISSKATNSVRSSVTNICDELPDPVSLDVFFRALTDIYDIAGEYTLSEQENRKIDELAQQKYRSWEWTFGRTPFFEVEASLRDVKLVLHVENGSISNLGLYGKRKTDLKRMLKLKGLRFILEEMERALKDIDFLSDLEKKAFLRQLF